MSEGAIIPWTGIRFEVVPDNDEESKLPQVLLRRLTPDCVLINRQVAYVRQSTWDRLKPKLEALTHEVH